MQKACNAKSSPYSVFYHVLEVRNPSTVMNMVWILFFGAAGRGKV
jgi:hypothetical protein